MPVDRGAGALERVSGVLRVVRRFKRLIDDSGEGEGLYPRALTAHA